MKVFDLRPNFKTTSRTRKRRAVSEIIATVIMLAIVASLGAIVFSFASTGLGNFGNSFTTLISGQGQKLSENLVVEQITFNETGSLQGANIYVRNDGQGSLTIGTVYSQFASNNSLVISPTQFNLQVNQGQFQILAVRFTPVHGITYSFNVATQTGNTVIALAKA
jgi:flagellin-like protein